MADRFYLGDPHVHSLLSDGRLSPAELELVAAARGLDFLALADHSPPRVPPPNPAAGLAGVRGRICLIPGQEISAGGRIHFLLLGYAQPYPRARLRLEQLGELAGQVHAAGGAVILAHPWLAFDKSSDRIHLLDRGFAEGLIDGLEVFSAALQPSQFGLWRRMFDHYRGRWAPSHPAPLASSDWHHRRHGRALGLGCTYVLAPALTPEAILGAIRARRTVAALQPALLLEDGLFPNPPLPFPEPERTAGLQWTGNLCGRAELVGALLALEARVERQLWAGVPVGPSGGAGIELLRAAHAARAAGNHRRAAALLARRER